MIVRILPVFLVFVLCSCNGTNDSINATDYLDKPAYDALMARVAPYVVKKPDHITYEERFDAANAPFYNNFVNVTGAEIRYYYPTDTAAFFFFAHKDLSSLYEHYRGLGGYLKSGKDGNITFLNLLYHTPRFTREEMDEKGKMLFEEMITEGNVNLFIGRRDFIHTPNDDFYYDATRNRWDYTSNSSWKFLQEEQQRDAE